MDEKNMTESQRKAIEIAREQERLEREQAIRERDPFYGLQVEPSASYYEETKREPGDENIVGWGFDLHPWVTFIAAGLIIIFIALTLGFREQSSEIYSSALNIIGSSFGWLYIIAANIFIIFMGYVALGRFGKIRIGGPDARPEFSTWSWFAMLMSAGMGIGLMFWSVGEPMFHLSDPSPIFTNMEAMTPAAAQAAMGVTYFHWGLHPWAIYALVALALAFFAYNRGLPLTIRSIFYPILKDRIYGFWGNVIDILSVLATLFGLATSLGLGVQQVGAGLNFLFGLPNETWFQVVLIGVITGFATLSVVAGLDHGVRRLSEANLILAALFLVFILLVGPTVFILGVFTQSAGYYLQNLPYMSFWVETFSRTGENGTSWQNAWTIFYWGWWISWSPYVGMFIARISKGRTVREFVLGVMLVPTLLSFIWLSTFGGAALWLQAMGTTDMVSAVTADVTTAMFVMLESFPFSFILSIIAIILVVVFFVTSSDSGSLVIDHLTSGGKLDSPVPQRIFWAVTEGVVAAVLLIGGGLTALQTASITTGLPFVLVLLFMCYALYRGLSEEHFHEEYRRRVAERERRAAAAERKGGAERSRGRLEPGLPD